MVCSYVSIFPETKRSVLWVGPGELLSLVGGVDDWIQSYSSQLHSYS